jgi:nucleoid-associated protein YgaU
VSRDPTSRHDGADGYQVELGGETIELLVPRVPPPSRPSLSHRVEAGDRLDLLAARYFGSPFEYWRIVDANPGLVPEDLLDPGITLIIPKRG